MNEHDIEVNGSCIMLPNGKTQVFVHSIKEYQLYQEMVFVLLESPVKEVFNENVFGLNSQGEIIWQIEKILCPEGLSDCHFTGINIDSQTGDLWLYNWSGYSYRVAPKTGKILEKIFTK